MASLLNAMSMHLALERSPLIKFRLHIIIGALLSIIFILLIARVADKGTPKTRLNIWGIIVCVKSGVFMAYQIMTSHMDRLKRWGSTKAYMILNIIDTVFWFALFVLTIMGTQGSTTESSRALGVMSFVCIRDRRFYKAHGYLPGPTMGKPSPLQSDY
ncbi:uncharacterized protein N7511_002647 [Penicillium nucicola]|uniref:uncharacterized protein n=1 Tax=Penicillium nucicola TaxID=1850975 RepID=UPI0025452301|nr:uncharacterized protein N7511_002647 [Penicillium nucicola]KAJ5770596.1 hypothetical protein N7511_002647 [Penicillium nucicola]